MNLDDVLNRAKAEMDDHIKQKGRCEDAARAFYTEYGEGLRGITVGAGEGRSGPVIYVYGETHADVDGLPDGYRGFAVVAKAVGRAKAL